jgi:CBS domain containing-hemolysin-like protein
MTANIPILATLTAVFMVLSSFISASEMALFSIPRERIDAFKGHKSRSRRLIYTLLMNGQRTLQLILLMNVFVNITLAGAINSLTTAVLGRSAAIWSFAIATALIIAFGEVLPKVVAMRKNELIAALASPILYGIMRLLHPLLNVVQGVNRFFLARLSPHFEQNSPFITIEELKSAVRSSFEQGVVSKSEQGVITNLLDKGAQPVKRLMIHRSLLPLLPHYTTASDALAELSKRKQAFALITRGQRGHQIAGVVTLPELLRAPPSDRCRQLASPPQWAPETLAAADLISFMFAEKLRVVCILDEFGALSGAFSLEDGLSRVMNFRPERAAQIRGGTRVFAGTQEIDAMAAEWLPECLIMRSGDARTLNGLLTRHLGRIPKTGERFEIDGRNFYIMYSAPNRIESVLIRRVIRPE